MNAFFKVEHCRAVLVRLTLSGPLVLGHNISAKAFDTPEHNALQATDTRALSPLTFNTAGLATKSGGFTFAEQVRNRTTTQRLSSGDQSTKNETEATETLRALEVLGGAGRCWGPDLRHRHQPQHLRAPVQKRCQWQLCRKRPA